MKPAMPPLTRRAFRMLLDPHRGTTSPPKDSLHLESINVMVATHDDCIADKRMRSDARLLTLRPCLNQNSPIHESARDGFLGRWRGRCRRRGCPLAAPLDAQAGGAGPITAPCAHCSQVTRLRTSGKDNPS